MKLARLITTVLLVAVVIAQQVVIHDLEAQRERSTKQVQDIFNSFQILESANNKNEQTIKSLMDTDRALMETLRKYK